jgi:hypothetical protein
VQQVLVHPSAWSFEGRMRGRSGLQAFPGACGDFFSAFSSLLPKDEAGGCTAGARASVCLAFSMTEEGRTQGCHTCISRCSW